MPVVLTNEDVREIIFRLDGSKKLAVELLYGTGMRLNEVLSLRILDLDFERDEITIQYGKGAASGKYNEKCQSKSLQSVFKRFTPKILCIMLSICYN